jgi:hypothetical protein
VPPRQPLYQTQARKDEFEARNARLQFRLLRSLIPKCRGGKAGEWYALRITPEIIEDALRDADAAWSLGVVNVQAMADILNDFLVGQLGSAPNLE